MMEYLFKVLSKTKFLKILNQFKIHIHLLPTKQQQQPTP